MSIVNLCYLVFSFVNEFACFVTVSRKLLQKQREGKKRMRMVGNVELPKVSC